MLRRLTMFALVITGLCLVFFGVQSWLDHHDASRVPELFLEALRDGDRETALMQLSAEQRDEVELQTGGENSDFWSAESEMEFRLHHTDLNGETAVVQYVVEKDGFALKPIFHLERSETGSWKIVRIENLEPDPRWVDLHNEQAKQADEELAKELAEALKNRPGATVER